MTDILDCDVLVVGLGPVGATLSALLAQFGLHTIALDKDTAIYPLPRAVHFDHEIMRLFQQLGIAERVKHHTRDLPAYEFRSADGQLLMRLAPSAETPSGWGAGYMFHQPGLEHVLRDVLAASPHVDVHLGWKLESFVQDNNGITASVIGPEGSRTMKARYVVGCDGAWSSVRETIGGGLFDYQFDEPWLVVDAKVLPESKVPEVNLQLCDPSRPTTCVLSGPGRHRWEFMILPGEAPETMLTDDVVQDLIAPWKCGSVGIERKAVYRFHGLVANRWRSGRALIAGDAAHQTPPFAGQGMCSGLRDAVNLAWKLEAVFSGKASEDLLDSYQIEREPHVRAAIELAIGMGRVVCTLDPNAAAARDAGMLAQLHSGEASRPPLGSAPLGAGCILAGSPAAGTIFPQPFSGDGATRLRMDDALGNEPWLISRKSSPQHGIANTYTLESEELLPFNDALQTWFDKHGVEAALVRPDRYVFGTGEPAAIIAAWRKALGQVPAGSEL